MRRPKPPQVVQISDRATVSDDELLARIARGGPALAVQLRDPMLDGRELLILGRRLRRATRAVGASLWINDRLDLALLLEADGVHLGRASVAVAVARQALGEAVFVTRSAHTVDDAAVAAAEGADAVLLSPIFSTPGKGEPLGVGAISRARGRLGPEVGLFALGGVEVATARACLQAGATGVAAIRADLTPLSSSL